VPWGFQSNAVLSTAFSFYVQRRLIFSRRFILTVTTCFCITIIMCTGCYNEGFCCSAQQPVHLMMAITRKRVVTIKRRRVNSNRSCR
jgi:hypothetical protein